MKKFNVLFDKRFWKSYLFHKIAIIKFLFGYLPKVSLYSDGITLIMGYGKLDEDNGIFKYTLPDWYLDKYVNMENRIFKIMLDIVNQLKWNGKRRIRDVAKINNSCIAVAFDNDTYHIKIEKIIPK